MPRILATSRWVLRGLPSRPYRHVSIFISFIFSVFFIARRSFSASIFSKIISETSVSSFVSMSEKVILLPSLSTPILSSIDTSLRSFFALLKYISTSFSMQRDMYVESLLLLSGRKVFIPFIRPIVPIEIKSSIVFSSAYFFAICATRRKFRSISIFFAASLPFAYSARYFFSSSFVSGFGNAALPLTYPARTSTVCIHSKNIPSIIINHPFTSSKDLRALYIKAAQMRKKFVLSHCPHLL